MLCLYKLHIDMGLVLVTSIVICWRGWPTRFKSAEQSIFIVSWLEQVLSAVEVISQFFNTYPDRSRKQCHINTVYHAPVLMLQHVYTEVAVIYALTLRSGSYHKTVKNNMFKVPPHNRRRERATVQWHELTWNSLLVVSCNFRLSTMSFFSSHQ